MGKLCETFGTSLGQSQSFWFDTFVMGTMSSRLEANNSTDWRWRTGRRFAAAGCAGYSCCMCKGTKGIQRGGRDASRGHFLDALASLDLKL